MNEKTTKKERNEMKAKDAMGEERFWVWIQTAPLALYGNAKRKITWHAFKNEDDAKKFLAEREPYTKTNDQIGFGVPPKEIINFWKYEEHYEDWE